MPPAPACGLREADIRPDDLMAGQAERFTADARRLLAHKSRFVPVQCPACDADAPRWAFDKGGLAYQVCGGCGTVYVSPRPPLDALYHDSVGADKLFEPCTSARGRRWMR